MFQQILYYINSILALPFIPILNHLGKKIDRDIPKLPEASENITGQITGNREAINLLAIGESHIAGVGVTDHKDGIAGQIALFLHKKTHKTPTIWYYYRLAPEYTGYSLQDWITHKKSKHTTQIRSEKK